MMELIIAIIVMVATIAFGIWLKTPSRPSDKQLEELKTLSETVFDLSVEKVGETYYARQAGTGRFIGQSKDLDKLSDIVAQDIFDQFQNHVHQLSSNRK